MNKLAFLIFILSTPLFLFAQRPNKCYRKYSDLISFNKEAPSIWCKY